MIIAHSTGEVNIIFITEWILNSKYFSGNTDFRKFITKVKLEAPLKKHEVEKKAQFVASRLIGPALDVYMRMNYEEKKDFNTLKDELLKEFERGNLNREEAISTLDRRKRLPGESAGTFAYEITEIGISDI